MGSWHFLVACGLLALSLGACDGKMARITAVRDGALEGEAGVARASKDLPTCAPVGAAKTLDPACLDRLATALGSKNGYHAVPVDQASAATVAVLVGRDGLGYAIGRADAWLDLLKNGRGTGVDALRLVVASGMAREAAVVGQRTEDEAVARRMMLAVATRIPGACSTYFLVGAGLDLKEPALPPELRADHSPCVQRQLSFREGPGGRYGSGVFRAAEGAMALWRETERALRLGLDHVGEPARARLLAALAQIEPATQRIGLRRERATIAIDVGARLAEAHAEAGVPLTRDAGVREAGADAGAAR